MGLSLCKVRDELAPWLKGNVKPGWRLGAYLMDGKEPTEFLDDLKKVLATMVCLKNRSVLMCL